jgi:hypothetical protein
MCIYIYILPKETNILQIQIKKKKMAKIWKLAIKIYIRIIKHYTDIYPSINNTRPRISCLKNRSGTKWKKRFWETFEDTKEVFRSRSHWELSKGLNIFYEKAHFTVHQLT